MKENKDITWKRTRTSNEELDQLVLVLCRTDKHITNKQLSQAVQKVPRIVQYSLRRLQAAGKIKASYDNSVGDVRKRRTIVVLDGAPGGGSE